MCLNDKLTYLHSTIQSDGQSPTEVKKRLQAEVGGDKGKG